MDPPQGARRGALGPAVVQGQPVQAPGVPAERVPEQEQERVRVQQVQALRVQRPGPLR
ncbi:MAG: hypothetical protein ACO3P1_12100 [Pseudomonadales bacterium]